MALYEAKRAGRDRAQEYSPMTAGVMREPPATQSPAQGTTSTA